MKKNMLKIQTHNASDSFVTEDLLLERDSLRGILWAQKEKQA